MAATVAAYNQPLATTYNQPTPNGNLLRLAAWRALSQYLPARDPDSDYWWQLTGLHLAAIVEAAGYPVEKQYEALLFHYHWTVPYLGQAPRPSGAPVKWKSLLGLDGTPIEYSWKWNTRSSPPNVRYVTEPIGRFAGTAADPLNQQALREKLHRLSVAMPSVDLTWVNHFLNTLFDHDNSKYMQEAAAGTHLGTSVQFAAEFHTSGVAVKTYFFPRRLGQKGLMPLDQWESSIALLDPKNDARAALLDFIATSPEGKLLTPFSVGVDDVAPAKSRLKLYFHTPRTSFASVREIMSMGGRVENPHLSGSLTELRELINSVVGLPDDFPENAELPAAPCWDSSRLEKFGEFAKTLSGLLYYFDVAPGAKLPQVKMFVPTRYYARDDVAQARGIAGWMTARGRGAYCQQYMGMLETLAEQRHLSDGNGIQTFVSCLFKNDGELDITTYLGAEAFHAGRLERRRGMRRRGD